MWSITNCTESTEFCWQRLHLPHLWCKLRSDTYTKPTCLLHKYQLPMWFVRAPTNVSCPTQHSHARPTEHTTFDTTSKQQHSWGWSTNASVFYSFSWPKKISSEKYIFVILLTRSAHSSKNTNGLCENEQPMINFSFVLVTNFSCTVIRNGLIGSRADDASTNHRIYHEFLFWITWTWFICVRQQLNT